MKDHYIMWDNGTYPRHPYAGPMTKEEALQKARELNSNNYGYRYFVHDGLDNEIQS